MKTLSHRQLSKTALMALCLTLVSCSKRGGSSPVVVPKGEEAIQVKNEVCNKSYRFTTKTAGELLAKSIEGGQVACVKEALASISDINIKISSEDLLPKEYPLFLALDLRNLSSFELTNKISIVKLIVEKGADLSVKDNKGRSLIFNMLSNHVFSTYPEVSDYILELNRIPLDLLERGGMNSLHFAISLGSDKAVKKLIEKGANLDLADAKGNKPLFLALEKKMFEVIELMINKGADPAIMKNDGSTFLTRMILDQSENKEDFSDLILLTARQLNTEELNKPGANGWNPLHLAVSFKMSKLVQAFLDLKADPNLNPPGTTILLQSISNEDLAIYMMLVDKIKNLNLQDKNGVSPVMMAAGTNNKEMVKDLVKRGVNLNIVNKHKQSALHIASSLDVQKILLEAGALVNLQDENGRTALISALINNDLNRVKLFLAYKADPNLADLNGETAVFFAESIEALKLLVSRGANINMANKEGWTVLYKYFNKFMNENSSEPKINFIKTAVSLGANPNIFPSDKEPMLLRLAQKSEPTDYGVRRGLDYSLLMKLFIDAKADLDVKNKHGNTLLHFVDTVAEAKVVLAYQPDMTVVNKYRLTPLKQKESELKALSMQIEFAERSLKVELERLNKILLKLNDETIEIQTRAKLEKDLEETKNSVKGYQRRMKQWKPIEAELKGIVTLFRNAL